MHDSEDKSPDSNSKEVFMISLNCFKFLVVSNRFFCGPKWALSSTLQRIWQIRLGVEPVVCLTAPLGGGVNRPGDGGAYRRKRWDMFFYPGLSENQNMYYWTTFRACWKLRDVP